MKIKIVLSMIEGGHFLRLLKTLSPSLSFSSSLFCSLTCAASSEYKLTASLTDEKSVITTIIMIRINNGHINNRKKEGGGRGRK